MSALSSFPLLLPDLELDLLDLELEDLEIPFFESDFDLLDGLLSFLDLSSLEVMTSGFFSTLASFFSECNFLLGSLLLGSLDSGFSSP